MDSSVLPVHVRLAVLQSGQISLVMRVVAGANASLIDVRQYIVFTFSSVKYGLFYWLFIEWASRYSLCLQY